MLARVDRGRNPLLQQDGSQGNAQAQGLRTCDQVRQKIFLVLSDKLMERKPFSGATQATLNFVCYQQSTSLRGETPRCAIERFRNRPDSAFTLYGLDQHRADIVGELSFEIFNIIELDEFESGQQRFKRF